MPESPTPTVRPVAPVRRLLTSFAVVALLTAGLAVPVFAQEPTAEPPAASLQDTGTDAEATAEEQDPAEVYQPADSSEDGDDMEIFVDTVDVRVVNVDVYVTDKQGNRVTGLTRDDFVLYEDRRPVAITNFYAMESGAPVGDAAPAPLDVEAPPLPEAVQTAEERRAEELPADQRLFLVIYVDNFNLRPANRNRILDDLGFFLTTEVERGDQVMLVSYDRSLNIRRSFTGEPAAVARALEELERLTGHAVSRDTERTDALRRISEAKTSAQATTFARLYAESMQNDLRFTLGALRQFIDQLSGLPGRKALLYISDGIPMVPGQDAFHAIDSAVGYSAISESFQYDQSREFDRLASAANANRVTFYTIDAAGLRLASTFSADNPNPQVNLQVDSTYNNNHQSPLRFMAEETGGLAVVNTNRILPRMKTIAEDFNTYYSLGYSPARAGSGRYHDIRVEVKGRKDLVVRHRQGYRDKSVEAQMTDGTLSALRFGFNSNPLHVSLEFDEATRRDRRHYVVPVNVQIPLSELVFVPRTGTYEARVRLYLAALDSQGDSSPVQQVQVPISIPEDEIERARGQLYRYTVPLLMRSGSHQVSVGVRDELASRESYVVDSVQVGSRRDASEILDRGRGE